MAQFKIYRRRSRLEGIQPRLSDAIHTVAMETLGLPEDKRFHRFIPNPAVAVLSIDVMP